MRIAINVPEDVFRTPKTHEEAAQELRQAAVIFWLARGDVSADSTAEITALPDPPGEGTLMDLLLAMPDVGEDADFERPIDYGREVPEWHT